MPQAPSHPLWGTFVSIPRDTKAQKEGPRSPSGTPRSSLTLGRMTGKTIGPVVEFALPTMHVALRRQTHPRLLGSLPQTPTLPRRAHSPTLSFQGTRIVFGSHLYCHLLILRRPSQSPPLKGPALQVWSPPHGTLGTVVHGCCLHCLSPGPPPLTVTWILALALT